MRRPQPYTPATASGPPMPVSTFVVYRWCDRLHVALTDPETSWTDELVADADWVALSLLPGSGALWGGWSGRGRRGRVYERR